ncbi:YkgJ family cysteine cluster protein [Treponema sp.]|uniref:YkgJ family cysteine cluster protein n=1 Tax=Treponema sp. TaxID=166 RepID=UPI00388EADE1
MNDKFYKNGLYFGCQRCSFCCGHSPGFVYLSKRDLDSLINYLKMPVKEFVEVYCRWADYYHGEQVLALREKKNYDCILWENGCSCYEARPIQCSTYPFWSWMIEDKKTWEECSKDCPGINNKQGKLWSYDEIEINKKAYDENTPLTRSEVESLIEKTQPQ